MKLAFLALLAVPAALAAQVRPDSGYFVATLGTDTVALERYVRTRTSLTVHQLSRLPETRLVDLTVQWDESGRLIGYDLHSRAVPGTGGAAPIRTVATVRGDSIRTATTLGNNAPRVRVSAAPADVPFLNLTYSLFETLVQRGLQQRPAELSLLVPQGKLTYAAEWSSDAVTLSHPQGGVLRLGVDPAGRLTSFDGSQTTFKVVVARTTAADIDAIARVFALRERINGALGTLSPRDTARAVVDGAQISIDYGRPAARGRVIFGNVVPWDRVWRTGANAATLLETNRDIEIGNVLIPAGKYSLWTIPNEQHWALIVNKQTGQWGTDYDEQQDLVRIDLSPRTTREAAERFTISINRQNRGGVIVLHWEKTQINVPFMVK